MIHIEHNANDLQYLSRYHLNKFETKKMYFVTIKGKNVYC